ncbi:MAG: UvrB/UvrC motif-containing protein, partial [Rhodothermales bacterium]|nr:UvrB/UvrC motif-containing protein [Rhodothermales bacterium]
IAEEKRTDREAASRHRYGQEDRPAALVADPVVKYLTPEQKQDLVAQMQAEMLEAAEALDFERAAELRDSIAQLEADLNG